MVVEQGLLNKIKSLYDLPRVVAIKKIDKGFLSENYKIDTDEQKFFLKKYRFDDASKVKEIHNVKKYFSRGEIPIILPIQNTEQKTYFDYQNSFFALFPFVTGRGPARGGLTRPMIISLGKTLGKVYFWGREAELEIKEHFKAWNKEEALKTAAEIEERIDRIDNKSEFDLLARQAVAFKKELIEQNQLKFADLGLVNDHLVHGDYTDQNVFFDHSGNIKYVFDLEKAGWQPRTQELFRSATYSFLNTDFDQRSVDRIRLYLKSYSEVYPPEPEELEKGLIAHYLKSLHSFWVEKEHYLNGNHRADRLLAPGFKRVKFLSKRLKELMVPH